jgi:hypothetical protein
VCAVKTPALLILADVLAHRLRGELIQVIGNQIAVDITHANRSNRLDQNSRRCAIAPSRPT